MSDLIERCPVLRHMMETKLATASDGSTQSLHSAIHREFAERLYHLVLDQRPACVVEVGMAHGASTLAILTALEQSGGAGRLISIDPFQSSHWRGCGVAAVRRAALDHRHQLIEEADYLALPALLAEGLTVDFAYIDGDHTFDYAFLDFWFLDRMLRVGGVVGFNDCAWRSVAKVIKFVKKYRRYAELPDMHTKAKSWAFRGKRLFWEVLLQRHWRDRYFNKREAWEPTGAFFANF